MTNLDMTKKYALAVSGGVDSMTMLHMFASMRPRPDFFVATVNHNIRKEAANDCEFVKKYCDGLGVECRIFSVNVPQYASKQKLSEETAARILRYQALDALDCDFVCLAHNLRDNAETVLMNILRGSGANGAAGISRQNGRYIRPLLDMTREEIELYAASNGVPFVRDKTNDDTRYTRNYIRKNVLPSLKKLNDAAEKNIVRFASNIASDDEYLNALADVSNVEFCDDSARIPKHILMQPAPIAYRAIRKVFKRLSVYKDIEKTHVEALIRLASGQGGKSVNLPFGYVALNDYEFVTVLRREKSVGATFEIPFKTGKTDTPSGVVCVSKTYSDGALKLDLNKLPSNAVFRERRTGDVFEKFGGGSKTLKKYLIDKKIPQRRRDGVVLVAADSEVYVVCGVEISNKVKTDEQSDVYYITIEGVTV